MDAVKRHSSALQEFHSVLLGLDAAALLRPHAPHPDAYAHFFPTAVPEQHSDLVRLFRCGESFAEKRVEAFLPPNVISGLEQMGILQRTEDSMNTGEFQLVYHLGLFLFFHRVSVHAKSYYGNDSLALSRMLLPTSGDVLDLCTGPGTQAFVSAKTASFVTATDLEESVQPVFWINAAMNGLCEKVEFFPGDLFEPVRGRRFERICANPPFLPVPNEVQFPLYAGGGTDGLDVVRRILTQAPEFLAPDGICQMMGSALGTSSGPDLSSLEGVARTAQLELQVSCYSFTELNERNVARFGSTVMDASDHEHAKETFQSHFRRMGASHIFYFVLQARPKLNRSPLMRLA